MSGVRTDDPTGAAERLGHDVLGPVVAEFCLRLWATTRLMERPDGVVLLFCARGGLRLHLAWERFLAATGLPAPAPAAPLMVSRLVALRAALQRAVEEGPPVGTGPAAAEALHYEFRRVSVAATARSVTGHGPSGADPRWDEPVTPAGLAALFADPAGRAAADALAEQAALFERHLTRLLDGREHVVLVDTGRYGTTRQLLAEGFPDLEVSSALLARSHRPGSSPGGARSVGLSVTASDYSPLWPRTAVLRYWHFVEWFLEPRLPSVRTFADDDGEVRSDLEVPGWREAVDGEPGSPFAGVLRHLDALTPGSAGRVVTEADRAWSRFRRAVVLPGPADTVALGVGLRSHDFGSDGTWGRRPWRGPVAALRGSSMWREGEIGAGAPAPVRLSLLAGIEVAHGARLAARAVRARFRTR